MPTRSFPEEHTYPSIIYDDSFSLSPQSPPPRPLIEVEPPTIRTIVYDDLRPHNAFLPRSTSKRDSDQTPDHTPEKTTEINFADDSFDMFHFKKPRTKYDERTPSSGETEPPNEEMQDKLEGSSEKHQEIVDKQEEKFLRHKLTTVTEKELDINYNNFFYNDDYKEVTTKRQSDSSVNIPDEYDYKSKDKEINSVSAYRIEGSDQTGDIRQSTSEKDVVYRYNPEFIEREISRYTTTTKNISINRDVSTVRIGTTQTEQEIIITHPVNIATKEKKGKVCSMLKLRQLNFNSPRTLPEVILLFFFVVFSFTSRVANQPRSITTQVSCV